MFARHGRRLLAGGIGWSQVVASYTFTNVVIGAVFSPRGRHRLVPGNALGWLFLAGIGHCPPPPWRRWGQRTGNCRRRWSGPGHGLHRRLAVGIGLLPAGPAVVPGRPLPSRRWRPLVWVLALSGSYQLITGVLSDGSPLPGDQFDSLISIGLEMPWLVNEIVGWVGLIAALLVVASLILRYRRGDERVKRQLLWLILAIVFDLVINGQRTITAEGPILLLLSFVLVPVAIGIAIVRYELLDIRLVISRTLLYGLVIAVIIAGYAGIVAALSLVVSAGAERGTSILAAIVVAICFNPVRLLIQKMIDRAFYGSRSDPARTARGIGQGLREDDDLDGVLERTRHALRLPWVTLQRSSDAGPAAQSGSPNGDPGHAVALSYRGAQVGTLTVGLRRGETELHDADRQTLELIGTPLAVALHATALTEQVQQARIATVEAGASERVRLQRELHDGLGPALTSLTFTADAASNLVRSDPAEAERMLGDVRTELRVALDNVRRVVYGLRPIELDDLGLVGALRQRIAALAPAERSGIRIRLQLPDELPALSPAVELAAYRIVNEAMANVFRHSAGTQCEVRLGVGTDLLIRVTDDGPPPERWVTGVGLRSVVERAEEVGGSASAGPAESGWQVSARLPLSGAPVSG